jgi:hypothetical protein
MIANPRYHNERNSDISERSGLVADENQWVFVTRLSKIQLILRKQKYKKTEVNLFKDTSVLIIRVANATIYLLT